MSESCYSMALSLGFPKTLKELGVSVIGSSYPSNCLIRTANTCFSGSKDLYLDIDETKIVTCDDTLSYWWEVTYIQYLSEYAVKVKVCKITEDAVEPEPTPPPIGEIDYDKIESDVAAIVEDSTSTIQADIADVGAAISGVSADIESKDTDLIERIADLTDVVNAGVSNLSKGFGDRIDGLSDYMDETIGGVSQGLGDQIGKVSEVFTNGLSGLTEEIESLQIPTLDSIKQGFLDTCGVLALALWDAILNKIEDRYPEDKEEED